jgi:hypothetical protein
VRVKSKINLQIWSKVKSYSQEVCWAESYRLSSQKNDVYFCSAALFEEDVPFPAGAPRSAQRYSGHL